MAFKAHVGNVRISPRKLQILADEVRGKGINFALTYLKMSPRKRSAGVLRTLLKSAVANADQKGTVDVDNLFVKHIMVNQGPTLKRFMTRAKGSASEILKRTSQVDVILAEK